MNKQQWEYCAITGVAKKEGRRGFNPYYPAIWHFTNQGVKIVEIKGDERTQVAQAIAQLGQDGWEMVGCVSEATGRTTSSHALYFKHPAEA